LAIAPLHGRAPVSRLEVRGVAAGDGPVLASSAGRGRRRFAGSGASTIRASRWRSGNVVREPLPARRPVEILAGPV